MPILRSATVRHSRVVLVVSVGDLRPVEFAAAKVPAVDSNGALLAANVQFRETIRLAPNAESVARWQSRRTLPPGTYFVQVTAIDTGGVTDCPRFQRDCLDHWSSVRRVVVASTG